MHNLHLLVVYYLHVDTAHSGTLTDAHGTRKNKKKVFIVLIRKSKRL